MKIQNLILWCIFLMVSCKEEPKPKTIASQHKNNDNPCIYNVSENINRINLNEKEQNIAKNIDIIFRQKKEYAAFNGVILVAKNGKIIYKNKNGYKNLSQKDSFNFNTPFQLASLSKPFTALALLDLVKEKKLYLDSTVAHYIPKFPYKQITLKHLLSHTSGLPDYVKNSSITYGNNKQKLNEIIAEKPSFFQPKFECGKRFEYSNTNYVLAAEICEIAAQKTFDDFIKNDILKKINIENAHCVNDKDTAFNNAKALGYQGKSVKTLNAYDLILGDKSLYLSAIDLYYFYLSMRNHCILNDSLFTAMTSPQTLFGKKYGKAYGLGFRMYVYPEKKYIFHNGLWGGFNTTFFYSPSDDYSIIILGNTSNKNVYEISGIVDALQDEFLGANYYKYLARSNNYDPNEASIRPAGLRNDYDLPMLKVDTNQITIKRKYLPKLKIDTGYTSIHKRVIALPKKTIIRKKSASEMKIKKK